MLLAMKNIILVLILLFVPMLLKGQNRADFEICGKDGCTGLICISPTDTLYDVKINIKLPTSCTVTKFEVDWGDGTIESFTMPTNLEKPHTYNLKSFLKSCFVDTKPFKIFVTPNCINTDKGQTLTFNKKPTAAIGLLQDACEGKPINLQNNSCPANSSDITYLWDLGNGQTSTSFQPIISAANVNSSPYKVKLTVNSNLCGSSSADISIPVKKFPVANYKTTGYTVSNQDTVVCLSNGGILTLDGTVSIDESRYFWEITGGTYTFLDNTNRNSPIIKIQLKETKNYSISLKAINDCGESQPLVCVHRVVDSPNLSITQQPDVCTPIRYKIPNFITGATYTLNGNPIRENEEIDIPLANTPNVVVGTLSNMCGQQVVRDTFYVSAPQVARILSFRDTTVCAGSPVLALTTNVQTGAWAGQFIVNRTQFSPSTVGTYLLTYTNGSGSCASSDQAKVTVVGVNITTQDVSVCQGQPFVVLKGTPITGVWSTASCPSCTIKNDTLFLTGGISSNLQMVYKVTENGCSSEKKAVVTIGSAKADFSINGTCLGQPITVANLSTGTNTYRWFLNGVMISTDPTPNLSNIASGVNTVVFEVTSGTCKDELTKQFRVVAPPSSADFSTNVAEGCGPLDIVFTPSGIANSDVNYDWDFGNGNTSSLFQPTIQTFTNQSSSSKKYKVIFKASNTCGTINTEKEITLKPIPIAKIGVDSTVVRCSPANILFSNRSKGNNSDISWDWGDGKVEHSIADTLRHLFAATDTIKTYVVKLSVKNDCAVSQDTVAIKVYPNTVIPLFSMSQSIVCPNDTILFLDSTKPIPDKWVWKFGDGTGPVMASNPKHIFLQPNQTFTITLIAYTQCGYDSVQRQIKTRDIPKGDFNVPRLMCVGAPVVFNNLSDINLYSAKWNFGDNSSIDSINFSPKHQYTSGGDKTVIMSLIDYRTRCKNDIVKRVYISPKVKASFELMTDSIACSPATIRFINKSLNANTYSWRFSDGRSSEAESPEINFTAGHYEAYLQASLNGVCQDSTSAVTFVVDSCKVFFPEVFTPNNDGIGDRYTIFGTGIKIIKSLIIRNKWGEVVFKNENFLPNITAYGWDGYYLGNPAPNGIYVYEVELELYGKPPEKMPIGYINLMRKYE